MRRLLVIAAVALAAAACGPYDHWYPVQVNWTFGGKSCADAGVAKMQIDVEGEVLTPNLFTCQQADKGVDLGQFLAGAYTVTVTGYDPSENITYQTTQVIQVTGRSNNLFNIDAAPTTGDVTISWAFTGKSCANAGVSVVRVSIDGQVITDAQGHPDLPCTSANGDGTIIGPLSPGNHTLSLAAAGSGDDYAADNVPFTIVAGQGTPVAVNLAVAAPTTASAEVRWTFGNGLNCQQAGVDHIWIYFDPPASGSWGNSIADVACAGVGGAPVTELQIVDIPDGNHAFAIRGTKSNQLLFYTHHPLQTQFAAPFTTVVDVTAEALP